MATLRSGAQAVAWAKTIHTWPHAYCLNFVWSAFGGVPSYLPPHTGSVQRAIDGWNWSAHKHPWDRNPPAGVPLYFTAASGGATAGQGHVCLSTGGGNVISTDINGYGTVGPSTISTIERVWGRKFLGWTGDILGRMIDISGYAGDSSTSLEPPEVILARLRNTEMYVAYDTAGGGHLFTERGSTPLTQQTAGLFYRLMNSDQTKQSPTAVGQPDVVEKFLYAEIQLMDSVLRNLKPL